MDHALPVSPGRHLGDRGSLVVKVPAIESVWGNGGSRLRVAGKGHDLVADPVALSVKGPPTAGKDEVAPGSGIEVALGM